MINAGSETISFGKEGSYEPGIAPPPHVQGVVTASNRSPAGKLKVGCGRSGEPDEQFKYLVE